MLHYARWKSGTKDLELDLVAFDSGFRPKEALEMKYTDRIANAAQRMGTVDPLLPEQ